MGRTRWKNRSDEDKKRIHEEQKAQRKDNTNPRSSKFVGDIYRNGGIPIMCPKCLGWSSSDKYVIVKEIPPFGGINDKTNMLQGTCRRCKSNMSRIFPSPISDESMIFATILVRLKDKGRLEDRRIKNE